MIKTGTDYFPLRLHFQVKTLTPNKKPALSNQIMSLNQLMIPSHEVNQSCSESTQPQGRTKVSHSQRHEGGQEVTEDTCEHEKASRCQQRCLVRHWTELAGTLRLKKKLAPQRYNMAVTGELAVINNTSAT